MPAFEKKIYSFLEKKLIYIVLVVAFGVGGYTRLRGLYADTTCLGGQLWENSATYTHSGLYTCYIRLLWVGLCKANYDHYRYTFVLADMCMAILAGICLGKDLKKAGNSSWKDSGILLASLLMLSPLSFEVGAVMLHLDSICISLILISILLGGREGMGGKVAECILLTIATALEPIYILVVILFVVTRRKTVGSLLAIPAGIAINTILEVTLGNGATTVVTGFARALRFWVINEATGSPFASPLAVLGLYYAFASAALGVYLLYKAFRDQKPIYGMLHVVVVIIFAQFIFHGFIY